jgi:DNA modification methylase
MKHEILVGDVLAGLRAMPDASVQCVVTSPPYSRAVEAGGEAWGLRDYGVEGQIGLEPTPEEYVERMVGVFREVRRVLRDDGVIWVNLGDSYSTHAAGVVEDPMAKSTLAGVRTQVVANRSSRAMGVYQKCKSLPEKNLVGIPWRVAFALQADGWYLRSDIIWSKSACVPSTAEDKPNPMPESVTDRPTKSHEYVFLLTKSSRYFYDADAVREEHKQESLARVEQGWHCDRLNQGNSLARGEPSAISVSKMGDRWCNPAGRNRRSVWEVATQPTPEAHFATMPEALVEPCIKAGTSERGCCPTCGAPWRRVTEREEDAGLARSAGGKADEQPETDRAKRLGQRRNAARAAGGDHTNPFGGRMTARWAPTCTCSAGDPIPCTVLDPFGGSGTVAKVARDLGRSSVMIELNPAYVGIMKKRLRVGEQLDTGVCEYAVREVGV